MYPDLVSVTELGILLMCVVNFFVMSCLVFCFPLTVWVGIGILNSIVPTPRPSMITLTSNERNPIFLGTVVQNFVSLMLS